MADTTNRFTSDCAKRYASLKISCLQCGHMLIASPEKLAEMFPKPVHIAWARFRLWCAAYGGRTPMIEMLDKPPPHS
jgi:hypothetical protein